MNEEIEVIVDPFNGRASIQKIKKEIKTEIRASSGGSSSSPGGQVNSIVAGNNITVDSSDPVNPIVASTASGGISIGDTIGGTPADGGILYADSSDELQADKLRIDSNSYFGGLVTSNSIADQSSSSLPKIGFVDASGAGGSYGVGVTTNNTAAVNYLMIDVSNLSAKAQLLFDPVTAANSNFTVALANGLAGTPELQVTTTAVDIHQPLDMNSNAITAVDDPTNAQDAATKNYVDGLTYITADDILPDQTGNSGKYLTTNGSAVSWGTVTASPGGSDTQIQFNNAGSFGGMSNVTKSGDGLLLSTVGNESFIAVGPQGYYGTAFAQDEPHIAINTVRLIGNGGNALVLRNGNNINNITLFSDAVAVNSYKTPSNGIIGFYLTENAPNNAATITMGPTDQGFFARKARLQAQCETGLITADATINTIQAKGQTSQTGDLFSGADVSANIVFRVDQSGGAVFNENSTSTGDVRMEGDTDANLFFSDASADTVQIGSATTADSAKFYVSGKISTSDEMEINGALNHDGTTVGFYGVTPVARSSAYTPTNVTTDRSYDANATTIDELADVLGTLIADLQLTGIIG